MACLASSVCKQVTGLLGELSLRAGHWLALQAQFASRSLACSVSPEQASLLFANRSLACSASSEQASLLGKFGAGQPALCKQVIDLLYVSRLLTCSM
jgi:hypothetical protein